MRRLLAALLILASVATAHAYWQSRAQVVVASGGGGVGLQTSLGGFWSMETTGWTDDTANGNTLTPTASPTTTSGIVGNGLGVLNGSSQFLSRASAASIENAGGSFSVQAWVKGTVAGNGIFVNKSNGAFANRDWLLGSIFTSGNFYSFSVLNTGSSSFDAISTAPLDSSWHHLVGTYNSSTKAIVIYVDGVASGSGATLTGTANSSASAPIFVGVSESGAAPFFNGTIDQVGFWKGRVLSAGDVTLLYNSGTGLSYAAML